jgi:Zn-dependent protease
MNSSFLNRFRQDRTFWLIVAGALVAFVLLYARVSVGILLSLAALVVAITIHEFSHAWAASLLGDPTARLMGRVTLNPIRHLDPMGSIMMLFTVLTGFGIGWGKPVPVAPNRLRPNPRLGNGLVALSGPASNLALGTLFGLLLRALLPETALPPWVLLVLRALVITNIAIGFFNLIPLPPLDGSSVLIGLLSLFKGRWVFVVTEFLYRMARYGPILLFGVLFLGPYIGLNVLGWLVGAPTQALYRAVVGLSLGGF